MAVREHIKERHLYSVSPFVFREEDAEPKDKFFVPLKINDGGVAFLLLTSQCTIPEEFEKDHGIMSYSELGKYGDRMFENHSLYLRKDTVLTDNGQRAGFFCQKDCTIDVRAIKYYTWAEMDNMHNSFFADYGTLLPAIRADVDRYLDLVRDNRNMRLPFSARGQMSDFFKAMDGPSEDLDLDPDVSNTYRNRLSNMDRQRLSGLGMSFHDIRALEDKGSIVIDGFYCRPREMYETKEPQRVNAPLLLKIRNGVLLVGDMYGRRLMPLKVAINDGSLKTLAGGAARKAPQNRPSETQSVGRHL